MAEWPGHSKNMHENVPTWQDNCFCEPEPRWQAVADEREQASGTTGEAARQAGEAARQGAPATR